MKNITTKVTLNNGVAMPLFGLGVWSSKPGDETYNATRWALELGYRHIDTAQGYGNEADVGRAVCASGIAREEIFVTTKLSLGNMGYDHALRSFDESLARMKFGYVDLFLIHWPTPATRRESWAALEKVAGEKRARAIGVSNYTKQHLLGLLEYAGIVPAVNQVEFSPFLFQKELLVFTRERSIQLESYSPLTRGMKLGHPAIVSLAAKYHKTPGQIMIRWVLEHGIIVIPKSVHQERIVENANVFDFAIKPEDMEKLDSLNENFRCSPTWNPELEK